MTLTSDLRRLFAKRWVHFFFGRLASCVLSGKLKFIAIQCLEFSIDMFLKTLQASMNYLNLWLLLQQGSCHYYSTILPVLGYISYRALCNRISTTTQVMNDILSIV